MSNDEKKRGPKPQRVKTEDDFDTAIQRALKKKPLRTVEGGAEPVGEGQNEGESGADKKD